MRRPWASGLTWSRLHSTKALLKGTIRLRQELNFQSHQSTQLPLIGSVWWLPTLIRGVQWIHSSIIITNCFYPWKFFHSDSKESMLALHSVLLSFSRVPPQSFMAIKPLQITDLRWFNGYVQMMHVSIWKVLGLIPKENVNFCVCCLFGASMCSASQTTETTIHCV